MQSFIPTEPQITAIAVRVSRESGRSELVHTHGLYVALRKPEGDQWWTKGFASSSPIAAEEVRIGGWNLFRFATPVPVVPGETYALTVYNRDYLGGPTRLRPELSGDHAWYLNTGIGQQGDYPNGSLDPDQAEDIAFKVYAAPGPLPE